MRIPSLPLLTATAALLMPACTGWPRGWNQARNHPASDGLSGAWSGTWHSEGTGHSGSLRCAVFPKSAGVWQYRYRATWAGFLCAGFTVDCTAEQTGTTEWKLSGQRDLGPAFGGVFSHQGTVRGDRLDASYHAQADRGTLTLSRVAPR